MASTLRHSCCVVVILMSLLAVVCCTEASGEACTAPAEPGPCRASIQMYYYNTETSSCEEFFYGGCEGNANRYETIEACQQACAAGQDKQRRNKKQ